MRYLGDYKEDGIIDFLWSTNDKNGASIDPTTAGTIRIYKADGTGEITAPTGITDTRTFDGLTGIHHCRIDLSVNPSYSKGQDYSAILTGAAIDSESVNAAIATFSVEKRFTEHLWQYEG